MKLLLPLAFLCFYHTAATGHAAVLYSLATTALDGSAGENTYLVENGRTEASLTYTGGDSPTLAYGLSNQGQFTYFVGYFGAASLAAVGDSISLTYSFTTTSSTSFNNGDSTFRLGLYNSGGSQISGDIAGNNDSAFSTDTGYLAKYRPTGIAGANNAFYQRTSSHSNLWEGSSGPTALPGSPTLSLIGSTTVTGSFTLTLVETGVELRSIINGGTAQTVIDTTGLTTDFDYFSIFSLSGDSSDNTITFNDLTVTFTPVPEPGTGLLALGAVAFALVRHRRR